MGGALGYVPKVQDEAMRAFTRARADLLSDLQAAQSRLKAVLLRHAIRSTRRAHPGATNRLSRRHPICERTHRMPPASRTGTARARASVTVALSGWGPPGLARCSIDCGRRQAFVRLVLEWLGVACLGRVPANDLHTLP